MSVGSALAERLRGLRWCRRSGVEWWLLENGTVTPKASAGVSRDTSSSIPHGETPSGAVVHSCRNGAEVTRTGGSPISCSTSFPGGVEVSMESLILAQDERWRRA